MEHLRDYARLLDPGALRKVKATAGMQGQDFYQSVIQATWMNNKKKPLDDVRVRRAIAMAIDRKQVIEGAADGSAVVGGFHKSKAGAAYTFDLEGCANCYADCDQSGTLDFFDFLCFQNAFAAGCP